ncbi:MAG: 50S ribosomal protein L25/general stress protein Ctc, partial [Xanthomonadales bacterium]|nr:50S ribosomal protein L25/general stress protein Ctc [Xanthomonadales bacterium]
KIAAEIREDVGKGASRRLRRMGKLPAVLYGGDREPVSLVLEHDPILHLSDNEVFYSSILEITVADGRSQAVILRDLQRHPYKPLISHIDFQRVDESEELRLHVPIHFLNEELSSAGKTSGVIVQHNMTEVEILALPKNLPEALEVDLAELDIGDHVMLSDISLPEGVTIPALALEDGSDAIVVSTITVKADQGTGAAAEAEAEAAEVEAAAEAESDSDSDTADGDEK